MGKCGALEDVWVGVGGVGGEPGKEGGVAGRVCGWSGWSDFLHRVNSFEVGGFLMMAVSGMRGR